MHREKNECWFWRKVFCFLFTFSFSPSICEASKMTKFSIIIFFRKKRTKFSSSAETRSCDVWSSRKQEARKESFSSDLIRCGRFFSCNELVVVVWKRLDMEIYAYLMCKLLYIGRKPDFFSFMYAIHKNHHQSTVNAYRVNSNFEESTVSFSLHSTAIYIQQNESGVNRANK